MIFHLLGKTRPQKESGAWLLRCCLCAIALLLLLLLLPPRAGSAASESFETEILQLINEIRIEAGAPPLESNDALLPVARLRAKEIAKKFSHERPNGKRWRSALTDCNILSQHAGENLAYGFSSAADVVEAWMESESHRRNILDSRFNLTALSRKEVGGTTYWYQVFAESEHTSFLLASGGEDEIGSLALWTEGHTTW